MPTHKDAKAMAKSLRGALADRRVTLSHSECLEIVARQFGFADWNTLLAKLPAEEERLAQKSPAAAPWSTCSFCGKSQNEVRSLMGGCGGWEGFRARRGQRERSNVFICDECVTLAAQTWRDLLEPN